LRFSSLGFLSMVPTRPQAARLLRLLRKLA
jgi:hypothetical protein